MNDTQRPPLWRVMHEAYVNALTRQCAKSTYAAMINALRDWLPEPEEPDFIASDEAFAVWEERKALRALLTSEAERAERGDTM